MLNKCPCFHKILSITSLVFYAIIFLYVIIFPDDDNSIINEYNECRNKTIVENSHFEAYINYSWYKKEFEKKINDKCGFVKNNVITFYEYTIVYLIIFFRSIMSITYLLTEQCQFLHLIFVIPLYLIYIIGLGLIKYEDKILYPKIIFLSIDSIINLLSLCYCCSFDDTCENVHKKNNECKKNCLDIYFEKSMNKKVKKFLKKWKN